MAQDAGIRKNDIILMLDNITIQNVAHFQNIMMQLSAVTIPILIYRNGAPLFLAVPIPAK